MRWFRRDRGRPQHPDLLTPAEWSVLEHIRAGRPNVEIAERLGVSHNTVRYHVSNMLAKLELDNRHDLAAWDGATSPLADESAPPRRVPFGIPLGAWLTGHAGTVVATGAVALVIAAGLVVIPLVAGDGGSDPAPPPAADTEPGVFETMLQVVPEDEEYHNGAVLMGDLARYYEVSGEDRWDPDQESEGEYLMGLFGDPAGDDLTESSVPFPGFYFLGALASDTAVELATNTREALGIGLAEVDQWLQPGTHPPLQLGAIRGQIDREPAAALLDGCSECEPAEEVQHAGATYWRWGDDLAQDNARRFALPAFDEHGRGGRIAILDGYVMRAVWDDGIEAMLDAHAGNASLADHEDFQLAARGMDRLGALAVLISEHTQGLDAADDLPPALADAWELEDGEPLLAPYEIFATGPGWDDGPYTAVVLVHETTEAAAENAQRLPDRVAATRFGVEGGPDGAETWDDVIEDIEVTAEGRVVLATLHGYALQAPGPFSNFMLLQPLLLHE